MKVGDLVMFNGCKVGIVLTIGDKTAQVYFHDDGETCAGKKWLEVISASR